MACTLLTQAGDTVLTQKATYQNALKIFKNHRLRVESLAEFPDGTLDLDTIKNQLSAASASTKLIYLIPTFANPTGRSLDGSTKRVLVDLAQANNLTILADEVYHLLRFPKSEAPPPVMSHFDTDGTTVLSLGSFTKIIAPGLRIGWAHAKSEMPLNKPDTGHLLHKLLHHGVIQNGGAVNHFTSMLIANTVDNGDLSGHLNHLRSTYEKRASILYQALSEKIPKQWIEFEPATGGYYLWLKLTPQCPFSAADLLLASQHSPVFS